MGVSASYDRSKSTVVNSTSMAFTLLAAESPGTKAVFAGGAAGTTNNLDMVIQVDADESGGTDVQDFIRLTTAQALDSTTGRYSLTITVTPVLGAGTTGTAQQLVVVHPQTMDEWQTGAGRARQA